MAKRSPIPAEVQRKVLAESSSCCAICGKAATLELVQIIPSKQHSAENLLCVCSSCRGRADRGEWDLEALSRFKRNSQARNKIQIKIDLNLDDFDDFLSRPLQDLLDSRPETITIVKEEHAFRKDSATRDPTRHAEDAGAVSASRSGPLPRKGQNNFWFHYSNSDSVIVFVHGIFSDSRSCWLREQDGGAGKSVYWPALVRSDNRFNNTSIYLAGFYTDIDAGPYEIRNCADEVFRALARRDDQGRLGPLEKRNIVFVCHSTGGIVARYLVEVNARRFADKRRLGLVMIASPSYGSAWANRLDWLARLYNQRLGIQLKWGSWNLRDLDARFRDLVDERETRVPGLVGVEAYENHFIFHRRWLPNRKVVVTEESAGRYFGAPVLLRKTDHFTSVKPDGEDHPAHELLLDFWVNKIQVGLTHGSVK